METRKRRITVELQGDYLKGLEELSTRNFRQLREQIMAILYKEMLERGGIERENYQSNAKDVLN